jgi:hypothetical protein
MEVKKFQQKKRRNWYILASIVSILLIGAITGVSLALLTQKQKNNRDFEKLDTRQKSISDMIATLGTANPSTLRDRTTPQYEARKWMLFTDKLYYKEMVPEKEQVVQRYSLIVFYFATNAASITWHNNNWLKGFECDKDNTWLGLYCNENNQVQSVVFGKFLKFYLFRQSRFDINLQMNSIPLALTLKKLSPVLRFLPFGFHFRLCDG